MRDSCDLETWDAYEESLVRARKPHVCCETRRTIGRGELYWRCKGFIRGDGWQTFAQSWAAYRLARAINLDGGGDACWIPFGGLLEEVLQTDAVTREEWAAVCRGEITRQPVGDEAERLAAMGVPLPPVVEVQSVEVTDA